MTALLDPRAEEYRRMDAADPLKPVEAVELNVGILNSRWEYSHFAVLGLGN